jgi:hypothetical protein
MPPPLPASRIRNEDALLCLPPHEQFRWLHRFYLVLDRIAEQHRVYKLYGGPHGFMVSTGVAEPDPEHAATLLRFALHLTQAVQSIRLAGSTPLDLVLVLASGPASSGLLGTTSLTYQARLSQLGTCAAWFQPVIPALAIRQLVWCSARGRGLRHWAFLSLLPAASRFIRSCPDALPGLHVPAQIVGRVVSVAREIMEAHALAPLIVSAWRGGGTCCLPDTLLGGPNCAAVWLEALKRTRRPPAQQPGPQPGAGARRPALKQQAADAVRDCRAAPAAGHGGHAARAEARGGG